MWAATMLRKTNNVPRFQCTFRKTLRWMSVCGGKPTIEKYGTNGWSSHLSRLQVEGLGWVYRICILAKRMGARCSTGKIRRDTQIGIMELEPL